MSRSNVYHVTWIIIHDRSPTYLCSQRRQPVRMHRMQVVYHPNTVTIYQRRVEQGSTWNIHLCNRIGNQSSFAMYPWKLMQGQSATHPGERRRRLATRLQHGIGFLILLQDQVRCCRMCTGLRPFLHSYSNTQWCWLPELRAGQEPESGSHSVTE